MTGTPIANRPVSCGTTVTALDPNNLGGNFKKFGLRYCDGHLIKTTRDHMACSWAGASNLEELQQRLRSTIMIRRLKARV